MATPAPRKRKAAVPQVEKSTKTSLTLGEDLRIRLAAAAAMRNTTQNAIVCEVLESALGGIVVFDRRKTANPVTADDRRTEGAGISHDAGETAAGRPGLTVVPTAPTRGAV